MVVRTRLACSIVMLIAAVAAATLTAVAQGSAEVVNGQLRAAVADRPASRCRFQAA